MLLNDELFNYVSNEIFLYIFHFISWDLNQFNIHSNATTSSSSSSKGEEDAPRRLLRMSIQEEKEAFEVWSALCMPCSKRNMQTFQLSLKTTSSRLMKMPRFLTAFLLAKNHPIAEDEEKDQYLEDWEKNLTKMRVGFKKKIEAELKELGLLLAAEGGPSSAKSEQAPQVHQLPPLSTGLELVFIHLHASFLNSSNMFRSGHN